MAEESPQLQVHEVDGWNNWNNQGKYLVHIFPPKQQRHEQGGQEAYHRKQKKEVKAETKKKSVRSVNFYIFGSF